MVIEVTSRMPQEEVICVEGGIGPTILRGGKDDMEVEVVGSKG